MKPTFSMNSNGVKSSCDQYRNIKGVFYAHMTSNQSKFEQEKTLAKSKGLKFRIIKDELFVEKK